MSVPVILRSAAESDIRTIHGELEVARTGLGRQFIARVRELLERVEAMPESYGLLWQDVRAARLKQFRYVLYYVAFSERAEVLAVMHGSRDASAWQTRA